MKIKNVTRFLPFSDIYKNTANQMTGSSRNIVSDGKSLLSIFRINLKNYAPKSQKIKVENYEQFLSSTHLNPSDVGKTTKSLQKELAIYLGLIVLMVIGAITTSSGWVIVQLGFVTATLFFAILARFWKYWILKTKEYVSFGYWVTGRS